MQNENPTNAKKNFRAITLAGLALLAVGLFMVRQFYYGLFPNQFSSLFMLSPVIVVLGAAAFLMGLFRFIVNSSGSRPLVSDQAIKGGQKFWRILIWLVALLSVFPWWWLGILTRLQGGRPGNEGEGMFGFMMMVFIGLPMLVLAICNEIRIRWKRYSEETRPPRSLPNP